MSESTLSGRVDLRVTRGASEVVARHSSSIALLDRMLRQRRDSTGFVALLRDEVIAYQLIWPN